MLEAIQKIIEAIPGEGHALIPVLAVALEFVLRLVKSDKPLSVLHVAAQALKLVGAGLDKVGNLLDKILPQRLKDREEK